jgi:hypothetical protein
LANQQVKNYQALLKKNTELTQNTLKQGNEVQNLHLQPASLEPIDKYSKN